MSAAQKQYVFLSGLPRTGSTLLTAILSQNPSIYAEGNSALCQVMWDMELSCSKNSQEQLNANRRHHTAKDIISELPGLYYKGVKEPIIIDKCRTWSLAGNTELIKKYMTEDYKMIVMERSLVDIAKSFGKLYEDNGKPYDLVKMMQPDTDPLMRPVAGLLLTKQMNDPKRVLYVKYTDLVETPRDVIQKVYDFCGWEPFEHDFDNIVVKHPEDDAFYGLKGFHEVRPSIKKRSNDLKLPDEVFKNCSILDIVLGYSQISEDGRITVATKKAETSLSSTDEVASSTV
jgi:sulfotransferase